MPIPPGYDPIDSKDYFGPNPSLEWIIAQYILEYLAVQMEGIDYDPSRFQYLTWMSVCGFQEGISQSGDPTSIDSETVWRIVESAILRKLQHTGKKSL